VGPGGRDPWREPPERCALPGRGRHSVGAWEGVEQSAAAQVGQGVRNFYMLESLASKEEVREILACAVESLDYNIIPDSVDRMPSFEYYPFRQGRWIDDRMRSALEGLMEERVLPYVRERFGCPDCAIADVLVRRYLPGERRTHQTHFDGHAMVTAVLGLSDPDDYQGGLYLQPESSPSSRLFPRIEPGDMLVHSYDLQHGVHVWGGSERYSLIFWLKDSMQSVLDDSTPWYDAQGEPDGAEALYHLANKYHHGGDDKPLDTHEAMRLYERSAKLGCPSAMNNLATMCQELGAEASDEEEAKAYYKRAFDSLFEGAEAGWHLAQRNLAMFYTEGVGAEVNIVEARRWMREAAAQLDVQAAFRLSGLLAFHPDFSKDADVEEGVWWLERSAEAGSRDAQLVLSGQLMSREGPVPQDMAAAELWLERAARGGSDVACYQLAKLLHKQGRNEESDRARGRIGAQFRPPADEPLEICWLDCRAAAKERELIAGDELVDPVMIANIQDLRLRQRALQAAIVEAGERGLAEVMFQLHLDIGQCFLLSQKLDMAESLFQDLFGLCSELGGGDAAVSLRQAIVRNNFAVSVLRLQEKWTEAEYELIQALLECERMRGEHDEMMLGISGNLALIRMSLSESRVDTR